MHAPNAEIILENERNDYRFEQFVLEICSKHEGITFVPTSQSWDRGRDGRSTAPGKGSHRNLICATLNKEIDSKVEADLQRIVATSTPDRLIYCSSQRISEEKVDEIKTVIRKYFATSSVEVFGAIQLASLSEKYSEVFEKHYRPEIQAVRESINSSAES